MGEETEGLADGLSKYNDEIMALTGVSILKEGTTNEYKDLYDIFYELSQIWDTLSDTAQSRVSEILGGTRQLSVTSSLINNFSDAEGALTDALESSGTALASNEVYMDTIEAVCFLPLCIEICKLGHI
ncbi:MAG: hypothetical protein LUB59_03805 [Candidatus Gastranaerophilales bacterium]|nr:hypothetical protein [Candidatus Gastranaerophilales bacterium]